MSIGFNCKCGYETDLLEMDEKRPDLKAWEFYCAGCHTVISRRLEVPDVISSEEAERFRKYGICPGRIVVEQNPQLELAV